MALSRLIFVSNKPIEPSYSYHQSFFSSGISPMLQLQIAWEVERKGKKGFSLASRLGLTTNCIALRKLLPKKILG